MLTQLLIMQTPAVMSQLTFTQSFWYTLVAPTTSTFRANSDHESSKIVQSVNTYLTKYLVLYFKRL
jgi:hypothetical protein